MNPTDDTNEKTDVDSFEIDDEDNEDDNDISDVETCAPELTKEEWESEEWKNGDDDGDGIPNWYECPECPCRDSNWNGTPDYLDLDSDGDGIPDSEECPEFPDPETGGCRDTDGDGIPDYLDLDSDGDHLLDREERFKYGTDPYNKDTDGDGTTDFAEVFIGTDPLDAESKPPDGIHYVVLNTHLTRMKEEKILIDFNIVSPSKFDIVSMIDVTGSMIHSFENVKKQLAEVINEDLPAINDDHGYFALGIVEAPYNVILPTTLDKTLFNESLSKTAAPYGNYEILLESIYQSVVGDGFSSKIGTQFFGSFPQDIEDVFFPPKNCEEEIGDVGGVCFRKDASPLLVLFTDDIIYEIPTEDEVRNTTYRGDVWLKGKQPGHSMTETLLAMSFNNVKIITVNTSFKCDKDGNNCEKDEYASESHDYISEMTETTNENGENFNFHTLDREGSGIRENLSEAIKSLTQYVEKDVTLNFEGTDYFVYKTGQEFNTADIVKSFKPLKAEPEDNIEKMDGLSFYKVKPDTKLTFELTIYFDKSLPGEPGYHTNEFTVQLVSGDQILGFRIVRFIYCVGE